MGDRRLSRHRCGDAIDAGLGFVTEDRKGQGLVLDGSAAANMTLAVLDELCRPGAG